MSNLPAATSKTKKKLINERAWQLAQVAYEHYRLQMQQALLADENFNPESWQPEERCNDRH